MAKPHAVAARTEATAAGPHEPQVPDIRPFAVPTHWPPADWPPQERWVPEARAEPRADPGVAGVRRAGPAGDNHAWPRQFAVLLVEALAGVRPARQLLPWLSERGGVHLHRLLPLFADGHRPHVTRVLTTQPAADVIEMTLVIAVGPRTRALAVRLERTRPEQQPAWREKLAAPAGKPGPAVAPRWQCTDIEAA